MFKLYNLSKRQLVIGHSISAIIASFGIAGMMVISSELHRNANLKVLMDNCDDVNRTIIKDKLYGKDVRYVYETIHEGDLGIINGGKK